MQSEPWPTRAASLWLLSRCKWMWGQAQAKHKDLDSDSAGLATWSWWAQTQTLHLARGPRGHSSHVYCHIMSQSRSRTCCQLYQLELQVEPVPWASSPLATLHQVWTSAWSIAGASHLAVSAASCSIDCSTGPIIIHISSWDYIHSGIYIGCCLVHPFFLVKLVAWLQCLVNCKNSFYFQCAAFPESSGVGDGI
jgi:hypothetical protein